LFFLKKTLFFLPLAADRLTRGIDMKRISAIIVSYFGLLFTLCAQQYSTDPYYDWALNQPPPAPQTQPVYEYYPAPSQQPAPQTQPVYEYYPAPSQQPAPQTQLQYEYYPAPSQQYVPQIQPVYEYYPAPSQQYVPQTQPVYEYYPAPPPQYVPQQPQYAPQQPHAMSVPQSSNYRDLGQQTYPIAGYLDLEWGSPMQLILQLYPNCKDITDANDLLIGVQRLIQEHVGNGIDSRQFVFFQNHLYEVYVFYGYTDEATIQLMHKKLESIYGRTFKTIERESRLKTGSFKMVDQYLNYGMNLQVIFTKADAYNYYEHKLGTIMTCLYVNVRVKNEVEDLKHPPF
jgi:hypothetical protein